MTAVLKVKTKSETVAADIAALLRARNALIWVVTREEARVERYLFEAAAAANYVARTWDVGQGVVDMSGRADSTIGGADPEATLLSIQERGQRATERGVWVMRDLPGWLVGPTNMTTLRKTRNLARLLPSLPREGAQALIVVSPSGDVPPELAGHATVVEWPLPDRTEIAAILDAALDALPDEIKASAAPNGQREAAIDAAVGLNGEEAAACYARSLVQLRRIDPATVASEKKRVIARERVLEWFDPLPGGLDAVGGLDGLKSWLIARTAAYSPRAREYGLPAPKGVMLVGVPGCGKSLTAKAIATAYGVPLLRLDLGALKSKFVGESEGNLRKALRVIESVGRCVVWLDEIEKALAGATQGAADGGVSSDALGTVLSWMQERPGEAFVIATANKVEDLPPELLRKGRFDEIFFVDLPTKPERAAVLSATLRKHGRGNLKVDTAKVVLATEGFTGAEIAEIVPDAMFTAFADGEREIETDDLVNAASVVVPLGKTAAEKIAKLRDWAKGRARPATAAEAAPAEKRKAVRALDI
jgi:MoxR-like ATPase